LKHYDYVLFRIQDNTRQWTKSRHPIILNDLKCVINYQILPNMGKTEKPSYRKPNVWILCFWRYFYICKLIIHINK
jgi:hypothetical protein